jgi:hypothetical protein
MPNCDCDCTCTYSFFFKFGNTVLTRCHSQPNAEVIFWYFFRHLFFFKLSYIKHRLQFISMNNPKFLCYISLHKRMFYTYKLNQQMQIYRCVQSYIVITATSTFLCLSAYTPYASAKCYLLRYITSLTVTAVVYWYLQSEPFFQIYNCYIYCIVRFISTAMLYLLQGVNQLDTSGKQHKPTLLYCIWKII